MWARCFKAAPVAVGQENAKATVPHSGGQRMRLRLVSCLSGIASRNDVEKCPVRRKQPAAFNSSPQCDQPVLLENPLYGKVEKPDAADEATCHIATLPFADTTRREAAKADNQDIAAAQHVAVEQCTLLPQNVQQPEAQDPEQRQHRSATEELTLELKLQHQRAAAAAQAAFEAQLKQQQIDHQRTISIINRQHTTQLQQLSEEHTAALSQAVSAAQAESGQQQTVHEQALRELSFEMSHQAEQQQLRMAADYDGTLQSLDAEFARRLEQLVLRLCVEYTADMQAVRQEVESAYEKGIAALHSKLQHAQGELEALRSQLGEKERLVEQLRIQLEAKEEREALQRLQMRDAWGDAAPLVPEPEYPVTDSWCPAASEEADARVCAIPTATRERLVMAPLTDRCYMRLGAAMFTLRGANPLGPAASGKTETVKDFGKAQARHVMVDNCSDGVDYNVSGGLAQTGAWACLDEFSHTEVQVLSVVAIQIAIVLQAIKVCKACCNFLEQDMGINSACGVIVAMNPAYAGRSELPDNLKAILRPVSIMVPDFTLIAEIIMFSEGFSTAKVLAKKMVAIMELSQQQLSNYGYDLHSFVMPIARAAGAVKRVDQELSEELIMCGTMLDLIKPRLGYLDLPLFMALLGDVFLGVEPPVPGSALRVALGAELADNNLQVSTLCEVKGLSQASPAAVSRAGMIYLNVQDLGWQPFIASWLASKKNEVLTTTLTKLIERYMDATLEHKRLQCKELVPTDYLSCVKTLTCLFDALATPQNGVLPDDAEHYPAMIELWFQFVLIWSIGGPLAADEDGCKRFDAFMREMGPGFLTTDTVFDYCVDPNHRGWLSWDNKLSSNYRPPADLPFFKVMVPAVDTVQVTFTASSLVPGGVHTLLVEGVEVGSGKTIMASSGVHSLPISHGATSITFSAQTSSNSVQHTIEGKHEQHTKGVFGPAGGKQLIPIIDDLNMPQNSKSGFIPPLDEPGTDLADLAVLKVTTHCAQNEVAAKQLADEDLGVQDIKRNMCQEFVTADQPVADVSKQMLQEPKRRHNHVTPTNCQETVRGCRGTLQVNSPREVSDTADKLMRGLQKGGLQKGYLQKGGLQKGYLQKRGMQKLQERGEQGATMQVVCQDKKVVVAEAKPRCELLLGASVQDKRITDEHERQDVQVRLPPGLPLAPRLVSWAGSTRPPSSEGLLANEHPTEQSQQEEKEPLQCGQMKDAWGNAAPPVPQPKYPPRALRRRISSKDADVRVHACQPPAMPRAPRSISQAGSTRASSSLERLLASEQPGERPQEQRRQQAALQGHSSLCSQELRVAKERLLGSQQARLSEESGRDSCRGNTQDEGDSPDGWAIHTWDAVPSGSWAQQAQAAPDAQGASVFGVEPPPGFPHLPPQLPLAMSHPPEENPQQQPLPVQVPPFPGLGIVQQQQQQQAVAPPPQPEDAAQGQPDEEAEQQPEVVEMDGDFFIANKTAMLRWKEHHKHCTLGWVGGGVVDEQEEARQAMLLQKKQAQYHKFWGRTWKHDKCRKQ